MRDRSRDDIRIIKYGIYTILFLMTIDAITEIIVRLFG